MPSVKLLLVLYGFSAFLLPAQSSFEPGLRSITIYTLDKANSGSEHLSLELDTQTFDKFLANKEIVKSPKQLQNTFEFLNVLDGRCDIQMKCNKKPEKCETCKACEKCSVLASATQKTCPLCEKCPTGSTGSSGSKDLSNTRDGNANGNGKGNDDGSGNGKGKGTGNGAHKGLEYIPSKGPTRSTLPPTPPMKYPRPSYKPISFSFSSEGGKPSVGRRVNAKPYEPIEDLPNYKRLENGTLIPIIYEID